MSDDLRSNVANQNLRGFVGDGGSWKFHKGSPYSKYPMFPVVDDDPSFSAVGTCAIKASPAPLG